MKIKELLKEKILVLDGAMGTMIQRFNFEEEDFRGKRFANHTHALKGNNDILNLTQPEAIQEIYEQYLKAGSDIITTNTFNANRVSQADYQTEAFVYEMNKASAKLAKLAIQNINKDAFVVGSLGPTNRTVSLSPDVNNPAFRIATFNQYVKNYSNEIKGLVEGGADLLMVETIFDPLNAKAAVYAINQYNKKSGNEIPFFISGTISDQSGRFLTGMTPEAFYYSIIHSKPLSIGLNCSLGADTLINYLRNIANLADCFVNVHPNAGLPNELGEYDESAETMASKIRKYCEEGLINIVGGCCGTTPTHIQAIAEVVNNSKPRLSRKKKLKHYFSGLEPLIINQDSLFVNVGERTNVAGSRKFLRLINEKKYNDAIQIAVNQVKNGAQILDINMDDALLNTKFEMVNFVNLLSSEPDVARIPFMIDSSKFDVCREALACCQGRGIVNSISFVEQAHEIVELGGAFIVMAFDENGQAESFNRKIEICKRAYNILVNEEGIAPENIIFDANIFAIGTGIEEHANYGIDFIKAVKWIKTNLLGALTSGGISNISFAFRGNNAIREAIHAVFLFHAVKAGLDMGIVNPGMIIVYDDVELEIREAIEELLFNRDSNATEKVIELAEKIKGKSRAKQISDYEWRNLALKERLSHALVSGISSHINDDMQEAIQSFDEPLEIIEGPLMDGMKQVGDLFGSGKMFLPQVVKSARVMKESVKHVLPLINKNQESKIQNNGVIVLATVKGDVHDIGKNIVNVVLACNNYKIYDLGVMVSAEAILKKAEEVNADLIGLSGLITPSLDEMKKFAIMMSSSKNSIPIMIGGATTSKVHTALKLDTVYEHGIVYVTDASRSVEVAANLCSHIKQKDYIKSIKEEYLKIRKKREKRLQKLTLISLHEARKKHYKIDWQKYIPEIPEFIGIKDIQCDFDELEELIDWKYFFKAWELKGKFPEILHCPIKGREAKNIFEDAGKMLQRIKQKNLINLWARIGIHPANSDKDCINVYKGDTLHCQLPMMRQQIRKEEMNYYLSLADYIAPVSSGTRDYIGAFACTADIGDSLNQFDKNDEYSRLMLKVMADRLAEALAELLHKKVRKEIWGYARDEDISKDDIIQVKYRGIRPAPGYPPCPDHTEKKKLFKKLLNMHEDSPIQLTESFLMNPVSSVCGYYFAHPESKYFSIGKIDNEQFNDYLNRKNMDKEYLQMMVAIDIV